MDNLEKVEKLVEKTGVNYTQAKEALEASEWDLLDAIIYLEAKGISRKSGSFETAAAAPAPEVKQEAVTNAVQVADTETYDYGKKEQKKQQKAERKEKTSGILSKIKNFMVNNRLVIFNPNGHEVINLQVWVAILLFMFTFWITTIAILISFAFGYKYQLKGPELGKDGINKAVDAVRDTTYTIVNDIKGKCEEYKSASNDNAE